VIVITKLGQADFLETKIGKKPPENLICRLYINDVTPHESYQHDQYIEVSPLVYHYSLIRPEDWSIKTNTEQNTIYLEAVVRFEFSGWCDKVYGYYCEGENSGILKIASKFDAPYAIGVEGGSITVIVNLFLSNI
jgi:hypothetical protein